MGVVLLLLGLFAFSVNAIDFPNFVTEIGDFESARQVLRAKDVNNVIFIYDPADENSQRVAVDFAISAEPLVGFAQFYALSTRNSRLSWLLDSWNVQYVPTIRGFSWQTSTRPSWNQRPLAEIAAFKSPVEWKSDLLITNSTLKTFVLSLQGDQLPIVKISKPSQGQDLIRQLSGALSGPVAVLVSQKGASSQLFKAVVIAFHQQCTFVEVDNRKVPQVALDLSITSVPALLLFDSLGKRHHFQGSFDFGSISKFMVTGMGTRSEKPEFNVTGALMREHERKTSVVLSISTSDQWKSDVLEKQSMIGIFFIESNRVPWIVDQISQFFAKKGKRMGVDRFVWVSRQQNPSLFKALAEVDGQEPSELVFLSTKRKTFIRYPGEPSSQSIADFLKGPMSRGVGATTYEFLPEFQD